MHGMSSSYQLAFPVLMPYLSEIWTYIQGLRLGTRDRNGFIIQRGLLISYLLISWDQLRTMTKIPYIKCYGFKQQELLYVKQVLQKCTFPTSCFASMQYFGLCCLNIPYLSVTNCSLHKTNINEQGIFTQNRIWDQGIFSSKEN